MIPARTTTALPQGAPFAPTPSTQCLGLLATLWLALIWPCLAMPAELATPSASPHPEFRVSTLRGLTRTDNADDTLHAAAFRTHELGVTLQFQETTYFIRDVSFVTEMQGWAVGAPHWDSEDRTFQSTILHTQDGAQSWTEQRVESSVMLYAVDFFNGQHGWAVGESGTIMRTQNGGQTWSSRSVAATCTFRSVCFIDDQEGWATAIEETHWDDFLDEADGWQGSVWHTQDGGETWHTQAIPEHASILNDITFFNESQGWIAGIKFSHMEFDSPQHVGAIYATTNGGATWQEQKILDIPVIFTAIDFGTAQVGCAVGFLGNSGLDSGTVFRTTDGGQSWLPVEEGGFFENMWDIDMWDESRGYAVGTNYIAAWGAPVKRTLDGGATWETVLMEDRDWEGFYGVHVSEDRVVALGDNGFLGISTDPWGEYGWPHGENLFEQSYVCTQYRLEDVCFVDEHNGWAAGTRSFKPSLWGQVILRTQDGGQHWEPCYQKAPPPDAPFSVFRLDSICFVDAQRGWATGLSESFEGDDGYYHPSYAILHTQDGGETWQEQGSNLFDSWNLEFSSVQFLDAQEGWALCDGRFPHQEVFLAHTLDGGQNWEWVNTGITATIAIGYALVQGGLFFADAHQGWVVGGFGHVLHTQDGGLTWSYVSLPGGNVECVHAPSSQDVWVAGENLFHATDGGQVFHQLDVDVALSLWDVQFTDPSHGWIVGDYGQIARTADAGTTWEDWSLPSGASLLGADFITTDRGWIVGQSGQILKVSKSYPHEDLNTRWIPHITRQGGGFETHIIFTNTGDTPQTLTLQPYTPSGCVLPTRQVTVMANGFQSFSPEDLFSTTESSHVSLSGSDDVTVTIAYRMMADNASTAHVNETRHAITEAALFPAEWDRVFDGMALVNRSPEASHLVVEQIQDARVIAQTTRDLQPYEKTLLVFGDTFNDSMGSHFRVRTIQPSVLVFLRGTYAGDNPGFLYETAAMVSEPAASQRLLPHITPEGAPFQTQIMALAHGENDAVLQLNGLDAAGNSLETVSVEVPAHGSLNVTPESLFSVQPAYVALTGSEDCTAVSAFRIATGLGATAHLPESSFSVQPPGKAWIIFPGQWDLVFDGLALINLGTEAAQITGLQLDRYGTLVMQPTLATDLAPGAKMLLVFDSVFQDQSNTQIRILCDQPSSALFLRGTPPGVQPGYLFQTQPIRAP